MDLSKHPVKYTIAVMSKKLLFDLLSGKIVLELVEAAVDSSGVSVLFKSLAAIGAAVELL